MHPDHRPSSEYRTPTAHLRVCVCAEPLLMSYTKPSRAIISTICRIFVSVKTSFLRKRESCDANGPECQTTQETPTGITFNTRTAADSRHTPSAQRKENGTWRLCEDVRGSAVLVLKVISVKNHTRGAASSASALRAAGRPASHKIPSRARGLRSPIHAMDDSDEELFRESDDNQDGMRSAAALFGVLDLLDDEVSKAATSESFTALLATGPEALSFTGWHFGDDGLKVLAAALSESASSSSITSLSVEENDISDEGLILLIDQCASVLHSLEKLYCTQNGIGSNGVEAFCNALVNGSFPHLKVCDFNSNLNLGDQGLAALGRAVSQGIALAALTNLFLDSTSIGDEGLISFAQGLRSSSCALPVLYELWLSNNRIGDAGALAFFDALGGSATGPMAKLGDLRLQFNQIGNVGMTALSSAVERGALSAVWYLGLAENTFSEVGVANLDTALSAGFLPKLEFLTISSIHASGDAQERVQDTIHQRRSRRA